jgi:hypothetical protein
MRSPQSFTWFLPRPRRGEEVLMPTINQLVRKGRRNRQPTKGKVPAMQQQPAEARRLHARLHDDAEEAELGAPQGRQGAPDQRLRGDQLHPGRRPQPAGALGGR